MNTNLKVIESVGRAWQQNQVAGWVALTVNDQCSVELQVLVVCIWLIVPLDQIVRLEEFWRQGLFESGTSGWSVLENGRLHIDMPQTWVSTFALFSSFSVRLLKVGFLNHVNEKKGVTHVTNTICKSTSFRWPALNSEALLVDGGVCLRSLPLPGEYSSPFPLIMQWQMLNWSGKRCTTMFLGTRSRSTHRTSWCHNSTTGYRRQVSSRGHWARCRTRLGCRLDSLPGSSRDRVRTVLLACRLPCTVKYS